MSESRTVEEIEASIAARFEELRARTHPGTALLITGYIDDFLEDLLLHKMRPLSNTIKNRIFKGYGPLESLSAKIDIAYAFNFVDDVTYEDMRVIKDIRNKFAHPTELLNFSSPEIVDLCAKLSTFDKAKPATSAFADAISKVLAALYGQFTVSGYVKELAGFLDSDQPKPSPDKSGK